MDEIDNITMDEPNLNLFIKLVRNVNKDDLIYYLNNSWNYDKLKTIAIIFNCRDRLNGKKEKEISNFCLLWLKYKDNNIYKKNILNYINIYGCWNDLNYIIKNNPKNKYEYKLFAEQLIIDKNLLDNNENISLCAKWAINPNNKNTIKITRYLFNDDIKNHHEKYRKLYIVPLRKKLNIIETKLCNKEWNNIEYSKIPASALNKYKKCFIRNDNNNYSSFLEDVANNKTKLKITGLLPHEIIKKYMDDNLSKIDETLELQWKAFIDIYKNKSFDNIIPIIDVSGSMFSNIKNNNNKSNLKPIYISIALGLLISELNIGFLHNKVITFSEKPIFVDINGETLKDKIKNLMNIPFGLNTDFIKIADLIILSQPFLNLTDYKKMICLTDMQFDINNSHNIFIQKFIDNNIEPPQLIYWNLNGLYNNFPINNTYENTSIISGFSEQLLKVILDNDILTPSSLMNKILEPYYSNIIL